MAIFYRGELIFYQTTVFPSLPDRLDRRCIEFNAIPGEDSCGNDDRVVLRPNLGTAAETFIGPEIADSSSCQGQDITWTPQSHRDLMIPQSLTQNNH